MFTGLAVNNQSDCALTHLVVVTVVLPLIQGLGEPQGTLYPYTALPKPSHTHSPHIPPLSTQHTLPDPSEPHASLDARTGEDNS